MIEEILTDHPDHKVSSPAGDLLKFGVHALLSARPYHNHLGMYSDMSVVYYIVKSNIGNLLIADRDIQIAEALHLPTQKAQSALSLRT